VFPEGGWPISVVTDATADPPVLVIRPDSARSFGLFGDLWAHRDLLRSLADRDLRLRYRQTILGVTWVVLQPVLGALIFTFVFGIVAGLGPDRGRYFLVTFVSLAAWNLFSGISTRASGSLVQNAGLISKVWFPRAVIPWSTIPAALVDFAVALTLWLLLSLGGGLAIPVSALLAPLWILAFAALAIGCGMVGAALMVSYRDVQHILPVALQLLLYASPVAYAAANVPARWLSLYWLNPLAPLLEGLRASLAGGPMPPAGMVAYALGVVVFVLALGATIFRRLERRFADVI
jgi:lipopolysaccharide transport system permease protein